MPENDLGKALTHLYRSSRTSIEENGANTLYLALGLLNGTKRFQRASPLCTDIAAAGRNHPQVSRQGVCDSFAGRRNDDEYHLIRNASSDFGISVPGLDPLPTDESGINVKLIYSIIRHCIKNQRKWDVEEQAILGIFSFNKFIMWNDIHNNAHKLTQNKVVSSLINGKIEWDVTAEEVDAAYMDRRCISGRYCAAHHCRFISAGSDL